MEDFESKFRKWFQLVGWRDKKFEEETSWDWSIQVAGFIKDPDKSLNKEIKLSGDPTEQLAREREGVYLKELEKKEMLN